MAQILSIVAIVLGTLFVSAIIWFILKCWKNSTPRGFTEELGKTNAISFMACVSACPHLTREEQYIAAICTRPGYDHQKANNLLQNAKAAAAEIGMEFGFRFLVLQMAAVEWMNRTKRPLAENDLNELRIGVFARVPPDEFMVSTTVEEC